MDLTKKHFFEAWSWLKFNNLRLALAMTMKVYTIVAKVLKLKVRKDWELRLSFVEVTGEKPDGGDSLPPSPILNRVNKIFDEEI